MAFLLLALVLTCTVFGLFSTSLAYKILLSLVHLGLVIAFQFFLLFISRDRGTECAMSEYHEFHYKITTLTFCAKN